MPDAIFRGDFGHREPYPRDLGLRFELNTAASADFDEVMEMRGKLAAA